LFLKTIYRKIPYEYAFFFRNVYDEIVKAYLFLFHILKYGNADMFNNINIETTTLCNRRCGYCPNSFFDRSLKHNEKLMPEDLFIKILRDLKSIKFTGRISPHFYGEPLLDKRLAGLMSMAHAILPKAKLEIYTNGDLLDIPLMENLYEAGVRNYVVALHGDKKENELNEERIGCLRQEIKTAGKKVAIDLINLRDDSYLSNRGGLVSVKNIAKKVFCQYASNALVINYAGDVLLCCNDYLGQVSFGNVAKETLPEIWNKPGFKKIRKEIRKGIFRAEICRKCSAGAVR